MPFVFTPLALPRLSKPLAVALAAVCLLAVAVPAPAQQPAGASGQSLKEACKGDYKTFCSGVQPGGGRIVACLKQNADKVSAGCKQALTAARSAKQAQGAGQ
ncbi:cysteine rich repeat-containing protein [Desulfovibrio sp. TomC]|uniref:cysteine rich repeat-containing protein n=1 Tax=Desulfovibrio sp. TomC TaxID=1562888 RepID=UPI000573E6A5|nr:cysteine rich repeat-containing protein [Desulfovibrio sp. TomC]KHK00896.1 hypothetical protein NY78_3676 [Desulfovibrio sp. TomC]